MRLKLNQALIGASILLAPLLALGAEKGGEGAAETFLGLPKFVWFTIVNFIIFVAVMGAILRKPILNFLKGRKENVGTEIENAQRLVEEAERHHTEVSSRLDRLDQEIALMRDQIVKEGETEGQRIVERAYEASERLRREADFQAEQGVKMARKELREEAARLAVKLAEEVLERRVNEADRDRLMNEFLKEVRGK